MHAVSTNQIPDILHFNDNDWYKKNVLYLLLFALFLDHQINSFYYLAINLKKNFLHSSSSKHNIFFYLTYSKKSFTLERSPCLGRIFYRRKEIEIAHSYIFFSFARFLQKFLQMSLISTCFIFFLNKAKKGLTQII